MKRDKLFSLLWAVVLAFCIAFGTLQCVMTAFSLEADTLPLALFCIVFATIAAMVSMTRRGNWIFGGILLLLGVHLWRTGSLESSLEALLYRISVIYDQTYGWGTVYWSEEAPVGTEFGLALYFAVALITWAVAWTVIQRQHSILTIVVSALPLCACMVVKNSVPSTASLFLLILGWLLLILSQTVRRMREADGNRLVALMLIPALLCTTLLFYAVPSDEYIPPASMPAWLENLFPKENVGPSVDVLTGPPDVSLDLKDIGPRQLGQSIVMEVTTEQSGVLYLRGQSYDIYDGTSWQVSDALAGEDPHWPAEGMQESGKISIRMRTNQPLWYLPYYSQQLQQMRYGRYENTGSKNYELQLLLPTENTALSEPVVRDSLVYQCLQLPTATKHQAKKILEKLSVTAGQTEAFKATIIADYVKHIARYDLNAQKMPQEAEDFALWFLETADSGYCVHFATAAVVLLRAAGVPARYVAGFMTDVNSGGRTNVTADESHAWVEYLDYKRGWTLLDPTPTEDEPQVTEPPVTTEQTEPSEDTAPTQTTPSETTAPTEGKDPTIETADQPTATLATVPTDTKEPTQEKDLTLLWDCLMTVACAAAVVVLAWGQYWLRVCLRRRKLRSGGHNQRALRCWKQILWLSKLYKQPVSEDLEMLAQKARFSQHTLTNGELKQMKDKLRAFSTLLAEKPWYQRLVLKLLFAVE